MDINAQIRRMSENSLVRKALVEFLTEWETAVSGSADSLRYGPLAEKADAFIEVIMALAVQRVREDTREPSKVVAPPFATDPQHKAPEEDPWVVAHRAGHHAHGGVPDCVLCERRSERTTGDSAS